MSSARGGIPIEVVEPSELTGAGARGGNVLTERCGAAIGAGIEEMCDQRRVQAQLVNQLYRYAGIGIVATMVNAAILVCILWNLVSHRVLLAWLGATVAVAGWRYALIHAHRKAALKELRPEWWGTILTAGLGLSGMLWGLAGVVLFPQNSTAHQAFIAFVLAGMVAGAVGTCSSVLKAFVSFSFPALLPILFRFLLIGDNLHTAMCFMTLLFLVLTFLTARHINSSARELVALKEHFADRVGERTAELIRSNDSLSREIAERQRAENHLRESEAQIRAALREKEVLLTEIHHRVKNNLAVIISILKMQYSRRVDPRVKEALQDCHHRVSAMALIHESLFQSEDLAGVPLGSFARNLSENLRQVMLIGQSKLGIEVAVEAEGVRLPLDEAMPCGLILNELLTNALKYAFPDREDGRILISAQLSDHGVFQLVVRDNGIGFSTDIDPEHSNTLGFRLIASLVKHQMEGNWEARNENGACITVRWPTAMKRK
jgi:two-component sensor histidine kinase